MTFKLVNLWSEDWIQEWKFFQLYGSHEGP